MHPGATAWWMQEEWCGPPPWQQQQQQEQVGGLIWDPTLLMLLPALVCLD